jgi:hypothetical protein
MLVDGGLSINNPIEQVLEEARRVKSESKEPTQCPPEHGN